MEERERVISILNEYLLYKIQSRHFSLNDEIEAMRDEVNKHNFYLY